jgi:hypothetical protein
LVAGIELLALIVGKVIRERNRKTAGKRKIRRNHDENRGSRCAGGVLAAYSTTQAHETDRSALLQKRLWWETDTRTPRGEAEKAVS